VTAAAAPSPLPLADEPGRGNRVADAMITCPVVHDLSAGIDGIRAFFTDEHVHMALVVGPGRLLVTAIERSDLPAGSLAPGAAAELGRLAGRTIGPVQALDTATALLQREGRRRLAVVDDRGRLVGLLCLKKDQSGYCSDDSVRARGEVPGRRRRCPA
jgi:hypothetical protein